jgi:hypothetical protein
MSRSDNIFLLIEYNLMNGYFTLLIYWKKTKENWGKTVNGI